MAKSDESCNLPEILIDHVESADKLGSSSISEERDGNFSTATAKTHIDSESLIGEESELDDMRENLPLVAKLGEIETRLTDTIESLCEVCIKDDENTAVALCKNCNQLLCHACHETHEQKHKLETVIQAEKVVTTKSPPPFPRQSAKTDRKWSISSIGSDKGDKSEAKAGRQVDFLGQIEVKSVADAYSVSVSEIKSLPNGFLFVCDSGNKKLKLFGSRYEFLFEVCLSSEPGGAAFLTSNGAIISLPEEKCLQRVRIKKRTNIVLQEKRRTIFKCFKLVKFHGDLITTSEDDLNYFIHVIDKEGKLLRCIYNERKETSRLLKNVSSLTLSRDQKSIVVVHPSLGCIGLVLSGNMVFKHREPQEHFHSGGCSDMNGNLYIGCYINDKIVMINSNGQKVCDFLTFRRMNPELVYLNEESKLFVFGGVTKKLYCYGITY